MLTKQFRGMPRARLVLLLVLLLVLEAVAGFGLYRNNQPAAAAPNGATGSPTGVPILGAAISATPALLIAGQTATFSVHAAALSNQTITFMLSYEDGSIQTGSAKADVSGFAGHAFTLKYVPRSQKEKVTVTALLRGASIVATPFSVLLPVKHP